MEIIGASLLILALALFVGVFVMQPFLRPKGKSAPQEQAAEHEKDHLTSSLLAERDRILTALQELDFDNALGKVPADEYPAQRGELLKTGADVLRRLETLQGGAAAGETVEERIETAVKARRADAAKAGSNGASKAGQPGAGKPKDELEELIAARKRQRKENSAGFCPRCGRPVQKSDKFCANCGADL